MNLWKGFERCCLSCVLHYKHYSSAHKQLRQDLLNPFHEFPCKQIFFSRVSKGGGTRLKRSPPPLKADYVPSTRLWIQSNDARYISPLRALYQSSRFNLHPSIYLSIQSDHHGTARQDIYIYIYLSINLYIYLSIYLCVKIGKIA